MNACFEMNCCLWTHPEPPSLQINVKSLLDIAASSEGEMTMKCGEVFQVLEADSGDGWTRIVNGDEDGYVPTTYIEITFYS